MPQERVDATGRAFKGSQRQVQTWVNECPDALDAAILDALPALAELRPTITWRSPLRADWYREYRDRDFLERVGLEGLAPKLSEFWPARGPVWDALATYTTPGNRAGVILVEGKSYPHEFEGGGCQAGRTGSAAARRSRVKIAAGLRATQTWLGLADMPDWLGPLYQSANRLAHLHWLRSLAGVDAWLVHLLFEDDPIEPTTRERWETAVAEIDEKLGLADDPAWHANVFLAAQG